MMRVLIFAAGAAVGFVLGARSGRDTYDKLKDQSTDLWHNPAVQEKVAVAKETVKEKAPEVQEKVGSLAKKVGHRAESATSGDGDQGKAAPVTPPPTDAPIVPSPAPRSEGEHTPGPN
ncbi:MAG: YtxH domain-containing protein [Rhodococcus sp. (in: high G+C Gram-positive bacteria)]|uniref:YtxH domain-containing protein n=1 Tax=Rhodococcus sp. TaxID=1831 RepID=UPI003BB180B4